MLLANLLLNKFCSDIFSVSSAESFPQYPAWSEHWSSQRPSTQASRPRNIKRTTPRQVCANSWTSEERATSLEIPQAKKTAEPAQMHQRQMGKHGKTRRQRTKHNNHEKEEDKTDIGLVRDAPQDLAAASQQRSKRWGRNLRSCRRSWSLLMLEAFRKSVDRQGCDGSGLRCDPRSCRGFCSFGCFSRSISVDRLGWVGMLVTTVPHVLCVLFCLCLCPHVMSFCCAMSFVLSCIFAIYMSSCRVLCFRLRPHSDQWLLFLWC